MIKAIFFDYNGVINLEGHLLPFARLLSSKHNLAEKKISQVFKHKSPAFDKNQISPSQFWRGFKKKLDIKDNSDLMALFNQSSRINRSVIKLVNQLKKNYQIFLASNLNIATAEYLNQQPLFLKSFDQMFFSSQEKTRKPEKQFFQNILQKTNLNKKQALFIDDDQSFVSAAQKLGISSLRFSNVTQLIKDLKNLKIKL